jgi:pyridoxamine 5'-phosphate oxidase
VDPDRWDADRPPGVPEFGDDAVMTDDARNQPARTLEEQLAETWDQLARAVRDGKHEWHLPVVSTVGLDGSPEARTVVLRGVDPVDRFLVFNTDRRSRKPNELRADGRMAWTFYERRDRVQLRVSGPTTIHADDEIADRAWQATALSSRRCYMAPHAPTSRLEAWDPNLPEGLSASSPDQAASELGRANFMTVRTRIDRLERLELHHDGHLRALWQWNDDGMVDLSWLAP